MSSDSPLQAFVRVFLGFGLFMLVCSAVMLPFLERDSAEFVLSVCNMAIGGVLVLVVVIFVRFFRPPE